MSLFLDALLVAIMALCVVYGYKNGFFKSVMNLVSGILSLLLAYTFTPMAAEELRKRVILPSVSDGIIKAFASGASVGTESGEVTYDLAAMSVNPQVLSVADKYGYSAEDLGALVEGAESATYEAIEHIAHTVADRVASTIAMTVAFAVIFAISAVLLKIFTSVVGKLFKLPVIGSMNTLMGTAAGAVAGVLFVWVTSVTLGALLPSLVTVAPAYISEDTYTKTVILRFFAENSLVDIFSDMLM